MSPSLRIALQSDSQRADSRDGHTGGHQNDYMIGEYVSCQPEYAPSEKFGPACSGGARPLTVPRAHAPSGRCPSGRSGQAVEGCAGVGSRCARRRCVRSSTGTGRDGPCLVWRCGPRRDFTAGNRIHHRLQHVLPRYVIYGPSQKGYGRQTRYDSLPPVSRMIRGVVSPGVVASTDR